MIEGTFVKLMLSNYALESRNKKEVEIASALFSSVVVYGKGLTNCSRAIENNVQLIEEAPPSIKNGIVRHLALAVRKVKKIRGLRAVCISCHDMSALTIGWVSTWFMTKKPVLVYDAHEFELGRSSARKRSALAQKGVFLLERFLMKKCAMTIVVNDSIADRMQEAYKLKERPVAVRNIPHYWELDPEQTARKRSEFCEALGVSDDAFIVMYHGGVVRGRGVENLILAVASDEELHGVILGNGEETYLASLHKLVQENGVADRIIFTPAVPISELRHSVSAANCGVSILEATCENHRLALPNKFFECIQSETPVVTSDFPEIGKIVHDYGVGVTCDPSSVSSLTESLEQLRTDGDLYAECKKNLKEAKKELCWEREKKPLARAYEKIVEQVTHRPECSQSQEHCIAFLIATLFCFSPVAQAVRATVSSVGIPASVGQFLCYAVVACFALYALPCIFKRIPWKELLIFVALVGAIGFSWTQNPSDTYSAYYMELVSDLMTKGLLVYILCRSLRDYHTLLKYLEIGAYAIVVAQCVIVLSDSLNYGNGVRAYSPIFAYQALPAAIILLDKLFRSPRVLPALGFALATFFIITAGTRTPLLALVVFACIRLVLAKNLGKVRFIIIGASVLAGVALVICINVFYEPISSFLESMGLSSRTLSFVKSQNFFLSGGREILYPLVEDLISENPWLGVGVGEDRILIVHSMLNYPDSAAVRSSLGDFSASDAAGFYAHNIFLELVLQFGIPLGLLLGLGLILLIVFVILKSVEPYRNVTLIFVSVALFPLMLSGSYLGSPLFFAMLAFCVSQVTRIGKRGAKSIAASDGTGV